MSGRRNALDGRLLHEMLFGAVPLSMNGVSTKLHLIPHTRQLLLTKLCRVQFLPPPLHPSDDLAFAALHSPPVLPHASSSPGHLLLHQHHHQHHHHQSHLLLQNDQNAFKLTFAVALLFDNVLPPRRANAGDDADANSSAAAAPPPAAAAAADDNADDDVDEDASIHLRQFIESHFVLFDFHVNTLCRAVVSNLRHRYDRQCLSAGRQVAPHFEVGELQQCPSHAHAVRRLCDELFALANRKRLHARASPSVASSGGGAAFALLGEERRAEAFLRSLRHLARYDSSTNDFFLSTLVTALLTYNHSWLNVLEHTSLLGDDGRSKQRARRADNNNTLTHQLKGLFGHWHGDPAKQEHTCRTVVRGGDANVVENVLVVVGYFVRGVELLISELQPPQPPLFRDNGGAVAPLADAALQGAHERDIGAELPHASLPPVVGRALGLTGDERLGDLRYSMVGGWAQPSAIGDAFSALAVSGIGVDQSLRQVRRSIATQLRATVDVPLMPTLAGSTSRSRLPRVAFCLLADVDSKTCELLSCSAPQQDGAGTGILAALQHRQHQLTARANESTATAAATAAASTLTGLPEMTSAAASDGASVRPRSRSMSSIAVEYDVSHDASEADEMQRFGVHRSRLLPSEHIATTLGELREVAALGVSASVLCGYMDQRIALLVALARVVALQMHDPSVLAAAANAAEISGGGDAASGGGSFKGEAAMRASQLMTAEEAAVAAGVAPTDVPVVATIARLCGARWWCS